MIKTMMDMYKKINASLLFRLGLGCFFLTNSIAAWTSADEFKEIISSHAWVTNIISADNIIKIIGINDALVFLLILTVSVKWRKYVAAWGILWVSGVIYMTNFAMPDLIERLGVILLLVFFAVYEMKKMSTDIPHPDPHQSS